MYQVCDTGLSKIIRSLTEINKILCRQRIRNVITARRLREGHSCRFTTYSCRTQVIQADTKSKQNIASSRIAPENIIIRQSKSEDIGVFEQLSSQEGWMCSKPCFNAILKLDPQSFIVAADESGIPVGYVGVCNALANTAYLVHFVVRKDVRGMDIGRRLYLAMLERLSEQNAYMDVECSDVEFQGKKGFIHKSFKFNTYTGIVSSRCRGLISKKTQCNIVPVTSNELFSLVLDYDRSVYKGIDRERMLRAFLSGDGIYTVGAVYDGKVKGYGSLIVSTEHESCIQTVFGDDENIVDELVENMLDNISDGSSLIFNLMADKRLPDRFAYFESISIQQRLYNKYNLETEDVTDRMYVIQSF